MADRATVQKNCRLFDGGCRRPRFVHLVKRFDRIIRKPLCAFLIIAFSVSYGFHEVEQRSDRRLANAIKTSCESSNHVRMEFNNQIKVINRQTRYKFTPLTIADCSDLPQP